MPPTPRPTIGTAHRPTSARIDNKKFGLTGWTTTGPHGRRSLELVNKDNRREKIAMMDRFERFIAASGIPPGPWTDLVRDHWRRCDDALCWMTFEEWKSVWARVALRITCLPVLIVVALLSFARMVWGTAKLSWA